MPFELQPTLTGELLTLRPLRPDDWEDLFAVASDPLIWEQHPASNRYQEDVFRRFFDDALNCGGAFAVVSNADGAIIGSTRYDYYDEQRGEIEVGWTFLARNYWGGAHNGEMKRLMLGHAFRFVERVVFLVGPDNIRSRKALEKIGAVLIPTPAHTRDQSVVVFQITAADFK